MVAKKKTKVVAKKSTTKRVAAKKTTAKKINCKEKPDRC